MVKFLKHLDKTEEYLCGITLLALVIINFGNVLSRYFFHMSWAFTEEFMMLLFVWLTMLGTVIGFRRGEHLGLTVLSGIVPPLVKILFILVSTVATIFLMSVIFRTGISMIQMQMRFNQTTPVLNIPEPVPSSSVVICSALVIIRLIPFNIKNIRNILAERNKV